MMPQAIEIAELQKILKSKNTIISRHEIQNKLNQIDDSQLIFPQPEQLAMLIQLLHMYENSKRKVVIMLEELGKKTIPVTVVLGVLAEDWAGMANSVIGIIHQKEGNILFLKALTVEYEASRVAVIILAFIIDSQEDYNQYLLDKDQLLAVIREASQGSLSKTLLLEDETIKFEIYNNTCKRIQKIYHEDDIDNITGENGEALKYFSSRSREYLSERKISDLAEFIIDNYRFQKQVRNGLTDNKIKIKNFETKYEQLTGITFVCREKNFSIESFLKTLEFIAPGHAIKHHKSFVTSDGILNYRIEIVDSDQQPLNPEVIKSIGLSLEKLISTASDEKFSQVKSIGGFEHYARAIIPFLMEEVQTTKLCQVFINVDKKDDFLLHLKIILVGFKTKSNRLNRLISRLEQRPGIEILAVIPPRVYKTRIEVNIIHLTITLSEFDSIDTIFSTLKEAMRDVYGEIRDFDEGLRETDLNKLRQLSSQLQSVQPLLVKEIYFSLDELYRIETPIEIIAEIMTLCCETIKVSSREEAGRIVINYKNIAHPVKKQEALKTVFIISCLREKRILSLFVNQLKDTEIYFTKIEWNQRVYLILLLKTNNRALTASEADDIINRILKKNLHHTLIIGDKNRQQFERC